MRTITITKNIYKYEELSKEAKERVKQDFLNDEYRNEEFKEFFKEELDRLFPNGEVDMQYSLNGCQGDGVNVYGKIAIDDLSLLKDRVEDKKFYEQIIEYFENIDTYTINEISREINEYKENEEDYIEIPENRFYTYCLASRIDLSDWTGENQYRNFEKYAQDIMKIFCGIWEDYGYNFFYKIGEEELKDLCDANGYEFLEDGILY